MKPVNNVFTSSEQNLSTVYTLASGSDIKFYKVPAFTDTNFYNSSLSHTWSYFGLRTLVDYNELNLPESYGGILGTSLEYLPEAFYNTGAIMFSVPNDNYRVQLDGKNMAVQIPLNALYSGMTSGLTATTLYSSYIYNPEYLKKDLFKLCNGVILDTAISEPSKQATNDVGIGYQYIEGKNPDRNPNSNYKLFDSGVVYLVTNDIYNTFTGATGSSTSWGYLYNQENKYQNGARTISYNQAITTYNGTGGYDVIVGAVFLNSGVGFIWHPDIVGAFDSASLVGDPTTITGASFTSSGQTAFNAADWDFAKILNVKIVMGVDEWRATSNSSYIGTGVGNCGIASTAISLHDANSQCLAVIKADEAIIKEEGEYVIINAQIPLSQEIEQQTGTLYWNP